MSSRKRRSKHSVKPGRILKKNVPSIVNDGVADFECHAQEFTRSEFSSSQSSQLFINCCFAVSFNGVFFLLTQSGAKPLLLAWLPLTVYLTFVIWTQYRIYCLPVQYYRPDPESNREELVTLGITVLLAAFSITCVFKPYLSFGIFAIIILLNLVKLKQIKKALSLAPQKPDAAIGDLGIFERHLWIYLVILVILFVFLWAFDPSEHWFVLIAALVPLLIYSLVQKLYGEFIDRSNRLTLSPKQYIQLVASSFNTVNHPK